MNQIAQAAEFALKNCPKTSWIAEPYCDYTGQRLSFGSMKSHLLDEASRARAKLFVMVIQWTLTGTWPKFRNAPVYFLNEILIHAASKKSFPLEEDFPNTPPPWEAKYAAHFFERTVLSWYLIQSDIWAREIASETFNIQESNLPPLE